MKNKLSYAEVMESVLPGGGVGGALGGAGLSIPSLGAPAPSKDAEPTAPQLPLGF